MSRFRPLGDLLRPMKLKDLPQVLQWRNHPDIRRFMFSQHEISEDEHRHWFKNAEQNHDKHLMMFEADGKASGFVQFTQLNRKPVVNWGFYLAPGSSKGTGDRLGKAALDFAFAKLNLHKVCGQALAYNQASIRFHQRHGFRQEGIFREQHYDGRIFHDVLHFGLLKSEWPVND